MTVRELLRDVSVQEHKGSLATEISGLFYDSRQVCPGGLFFALPGVNADGVDFIPQALEKGAVAVVAEHFPASFEAHICLIRVTNARRAMAAMAAAYYGDPSADMPVIAVTGTNGKTSTTYLLEAILKRAGYAPALFGTVEYRFNDRRIPATRTTPEAVDLLRLVAEFKSAGADALILEAASHALEQHRVDGLRIDLAVFTNLTPDHLDYHLDMESYFFSKRRLFSELIGQGAGVINADDPFGRRLLAENRQWLAYGRERTAQVHPLTVTVGRDGIEGQFDCNGTELSIKSAMIGDFNVSNLLAAVAAAQALGIAPQSITEGIAAAPQVPGRLEKIDNPLGVLALVDYAHTSDALEQVLKTLTKLDYQRLICIFGCGGDRDRGKRPIMGATAVRYADLAILTSDNPRTENPLAILEQVRAGALQAGGRELTEFQASSDKGFVLAPERREAIEMGARLARPGDLLLVAGKGHENYQILGDRTVPFDDRDELRRVLKAEAVAVRREQNV